MNSQSPPKRDVFISYSAIDKQWADEACAAIEARQFSCWVAPRDILPGSEWGAAIISGIDACRVMVLIFSSEANASPQVRREIERGIGKGLIVLPFRIEDVKPSGSLEYALSNTHWLDGFKSPRQRQLELLADSVGKLLDLNGTVVTREVGRQTKSRSLLRDIWVAVAVMASLMAATVLFLVANNMSTQNAKITGTNSESESNPELPDVVVPALPRSGVWRFEISSKSAGTTEIISGHFRISDDEGDRRTCFLKEKPWSPEFEKVIGSIGRHGTSVHADFGELRGIDAERNNQRTGGRRELFGKGELFMQSVGEWTGSLMDKDGQKWDFKCKRITNERS